MKYSIFKQIWTLLLLLIVFILFCACNQLSNQKDGVILNKKEKEKNIIGTWKLIEYADLNEENNKWEYPYGKVKGYFTYTKNNIVNLNLSNEVPMDLSRDSFHTQKLTFKDVWTNSVGYFGKYTIDYQKSVIIHHVEGGSLPWYVGTDQKRPFYFEGDTLVIGYKNDWIRKLVKVD